MPKPPAKRWSAKQIKSGLPIVGVILLVSIKLWYIYEQQQVFKNAPEHVLRACAGANVLSLDRDAYYHCILRVQAGGQP